MAQQVTTGVVRLSQPGEVDPNVVENCYNRAKAFLSSNVPFVQANGNMNIADKKECRVIGGDMYIPVTGVTNIGSASTLVRSLMAAFGSAGADYSQKRDLQGSSATIELKVPLSAGLPPRPRPQEISIWDDLANPRSLVGLLLALVVLLVALNLLFDTSPDQKAEIGGKAMGLFASVMPWKWSMFSSSSSSPPRPQKQDGQIPVYLSPEDAALLQQLKQEALKKGVNPSNLKGASEDAASVPRPPNAGHTRNNN